MDLVVQNLDLVEKDYFGLAVKGARLSTKKEKGRSEMSPVEEYPPVVSSCTRTHSRTLACTHARTLARTHARTSCRLGTCEAFIVQRNPSKLNSFDTKNIYDLSISR